MRTFKLRGIKTVARDRTGVIILILQRKKPRLTELRNKPRVRISVKARLRPHLCPQ